MLKEARALELVRAVRSLHDGETVLAPAVAQKVFSRLSSAKDKIRQTTQALHQRELELLKLVAQGMSNKEIATELSISVRTVQAHLVNIFNKLGVSTRTEAVIRAIKEGWVTIEDLP
jgi:DNA-binding NarL/FixJ family response regulator